MNENNRTTRLTQNTLSFKNLPIWLTVISKTFNKKVFDISTSYIYISKPIFHTMYSHPKTSSFITKMKSKYIKYCEKKLKNMTSKLIIPCTCCERFFRLFKNEAEVIPKDVPKGHLVVYVGDEFMRFVIKISLLKHPLFKALLEQAQDAYGFSAEYSRLWIPCDVMTFVDVVWCARAPEYRMKWLWI